jgi:hypothetical protein
MIAPKWLNTRCQPIAIPDVLELLSRSFCSIHLPTIKALILAVPTYLPIGNVAGFAEAKLKRWIGLPVMTPKLSSYWLYFTTSTSYKPACALVSSMRVEVVCKETRINNLLDVQPCPINRLLSLLFKE